MTFSTETEGALSSSHTILSSDVLQLLDMLRYCRPHDSNTEREWVAKFIAPLDPIPLMDHKGVVACYYVDVMDGDKPPTVMFSSHVDTVHATDGTQQVKFDPNMMVAYKDDKRPLGADNAAGVWLLLQMIEAGVPGRYMFHRGEERGCVGSRAVALHHAWALEHMTAAVAFDRKADCSIITHQRSGRCCSDAFAIALGARLTARMPHSKGAPFYTLEPDNTGIYTDTAEYTDHIGECTNVSVGYIDEHTGAEMLHVDYLLALRDACCDPEVWAGLPTVRAPGERETFAYEHGYWSLGDDEYWDGYPRFAPGASKHKRVVPEWDSLTTSEVSGMHPSELRRWVETVPVSILLDTLYGMADYASDLETELEEIGARLSMYGDCGGGHQ